MFDYDSYFKSHVKESKKVGLLRKFNKLTFIDDTHVSLNGNEFVNFSSNNYLSLAHNEDIKKAAASAIEEYGSAGSASRYVCGNHNLYEDLENTIAEFKGFEQALVFTSGYTANLGVINAIADRGDLVILDKLDHASIIDGVRLSGVDFKRYTHRNYDELEKILKEKRNNYKKVLIITESIFSMDGDIADLNRLVEIKNKYGALLMVDEAHATGIFGENGSGMVAEIGCDDVDIEIGTLSKAIPSVGGYVCANEKIISFIRNRARSLMYTTSLPPSALAAAIKAIEIIQSLKYERMGYIRKVKDFARELIQSGYEIFNTESQIVPIRVGSNEKTLDVADALKQQGFYVAGIRPPTVPKGEGRIRISICMNHTDEEVSALLTAIKKTIKPRI